jgi:hypothetical protein
MVRPRFALFALALALTGCGSESSGSLRSRGDFHHPLDDTLRLNQLQAKATHNSYHVRTSDPSFAEWNYTHAALDVQLESQGVRGVELDVHWNNELGAYEVYHLPLIDEGTNCRLFTECLETLRGWSDAHPGHHPIFVQIEAKFSIGDAEEGEARLAGIDAEVRSVLPPELLITPDDVRGDHATLAEAIAEDGWPTLGASRGRFLFSYDCGRDQCLAYARTTGDLTGRVMFPDSEPADPFAGFMVINDPSQEARDAVEAGYLVRVFAESLTDVLDGGPDELDAALATGAQVVSTDFPAPRDDVDYYVTIPGGTPSRCNPVTAPADCTSLDVEDPSLLMGASH